MSPRSVSGLLADILAAADYMQQRAAGLSRDQYLAHEDLQVIFERKFEIIGEALSRFVKMSRCCSVASATQRQRSTSETY